MLRTRLHNKIGMWVEIPGFEPTDLPYHKFYLNYAKQVMCKGINGKQFQINPPYTLIKRHLGTDHTTITEIREGIE